MQSTVAEDVLAGLVDHSHVDEAEVTREEVEKAVGRLASQQEMTINCGRAAEEWRGSSD